jgi:hypothetical protein
MPQTGAAIKGGEAWLQAPGPALFQSNSGVKVLVGVGGEELEPSSGGSP